MKHQTLIRVHGYMVNGGMPEGWVELKLKIIQFGDGEKKYAHNICLDKPAVTLFLQGVIAVLCPFVPFCQGVVSADIFILVDSLYRIFVDALLIRPATTSISWISSSHSESIAEVSISS